QRGEVVDLAVEDGPDGAVLVGEGLVSADKVDDRQPPEPERGVVVAIDPRVVRPPVRDPGRHRREVPLGQRPGGVGPGLARDPAHGPVLSAAAPPPDRGGAPPPALLNNRPGPGGYARAGGRS